MGDEGYTLAECLAAMLVLSLAIGGLWAGFTTFAAFQGRTTQALAGASGPRQAERAVQAMLTSVGPVLGEGRSFLGDASQMSFDCGQAQPCQAQLERTNGRDTLRVSDGAAWRAFALPGVGAHSFTYLGDRAEPNWPPAKSSGSRLRAVALDAERDGGASPVFLVKLWRDEAVDCVFDPVKQDCRS